MTMFKKKWKNLQPWIDYFEMLQEYEKKGFLEMKSEKHEAYITRAALLTLTGVNVNRSDTEWRMIKEVSEIVRRVRAYAAWKSRQGEAFLARTFALHIVKEDEPHDLLYTVVLSKERHWWNLWMKTDVFDVISYDS